MHVVAVVEQADDQPRERGPQHVVLGPRPLEAENEIVEQRRPEPFERPDHPQGVRVQGLPRAEACDRHQLRPQGDASISRSVSNSSTSAITT